MILSKTQFYVVRCTLSDEAKEYYVRIHIHNDSFVNSLALTPNVEEATQWTNATFADAVKRYFDKNCASRYSGIRSEVACLSYEIHTVE